MLIGTAQRRMDRQGRIILPKSFLRFDSKHQYDAQLLFLWKSPTIGGIRACEEGVVAPVLQQWSSPESRKSDLEVARLFASMHRTHVGSYDRRLTIPIALREHLVERGQGLVTIVGLGESFAIFGGQEVPNAMGSLDILDAIRQDLAAPALQAAPANTNL